MYSRTCPVLVSHPDASGSYEGLAIIDDQSGVTFADPAIMQVLDIPDPSLETTTMSTITIEGRSEPRPAKLIHGLIITPLDGQPAIKLPPAVMQNSIPNSVNPVPSRYDVANTVGFQHFAEKFPKKNPGWPTLLLIGRDCIEAQWQQQYHAKGENHTQMVVKTPLGWALVGQPSHPSPVSRPSTSATVAPEKRPVLHTQGERVPLCIVHHSLNPDAHLTLDCPQFRQAAASEKWMHVNKSRLCPLCLKRKHRVGRCPFFKHHERCPSCQYTHAEVMGCRPSKTISPGELPISLPAKEPLLSSRESSSRSPPQTRRPLKLTEEKVSTRSPTPDSSKNVAFSARDPPREERPTVPQPTGGSTPQTPRNVLPTEDPPACEVCGSVDPTHPYVTCWQRRIDEMGAKKWELQVSPLTPPFNQHPILELRRGNEDILEELFVSTIPQPTRGYIPQTLRAVLGTEDPLACHLCGSVEKSHPSLTCWAKKIEELGKSNWELGLTPPTSPLNRRPILSLRRRRGDIVVELLCHPTVI